VNWARIKWHLQRQDWGLTLAVLVLMVSGVFFIYSASFQQVDLPVSRMYQRQILWALVGIGGYVTLAMNDYRRIASAAWWIYAVTLVLLVLVLFVGKQVHGASRWLSLFNIQVQPAEFAKLGVLLLVARYWSRPDLDPDHPGYLVAALGMALIPFLLIARQPDLGTAMTLWPMTLVILFVGGVRLKWLVILAMVGLMLLPVGWFSLGQYQQNRILVFIDADRDPYGAGWNRIQSQIAVGSGGLTGKGYLQGTQNVLGYLPRAVAPTDFIYSVIAEEKGFVGSVTMLLLYGVMLAAGIRAAVVARDRLGRYLAAGITGLIFFHVFVNVAMTVGLMPITGLPLPLMSYGGSFMVSTMLCLGLLQSIIIRRGRRF